MDKSGDVKSLKENGLQNEGKSANYMAKLRQRTQFVFYNEDSSDEDDSIPKRKKQRNSKGQREVKKRASNEKATTSRHASSIVKKQTTQVPLKVKKQRPSISPPERRRNRELNNGRKSHESKRSSLVEKRTRSVGVESLQGLTEKLKQEDPKLRQKPFVKLVDCTKEFERRETLRRVNLCDTEIIEPCKLIVTRGKTQAEKERILRKHSKYIADTIVKPDAEGNQMKVYTDFVKMGLPPNSILSPDLDPKIAEEVVPLNRCRIICEDGAADFLFEIMNQDDFFAKIFANTEIIDQSSTALTPQKQEIVVIQHLADLYNDVSKIENEANSPLKEIPEGIAHSSGTEVIDIEALGKCDKADGPSDSEQNLTDKEGDILQPALTNSPLVESSEVSSTFSNTVAVASSEFNENMALNEETLLQPEIGFDPSTFLDDFDTIELDISLEDPADPSLNSLDEDLITEGNSVDASAGSNIGTRIPELQGKSDLVIPNSSSKSNDISVSEALGCKELVLKMSEDLRGSSCATPLDLTQEACSGESKLHQKEPFGESKDTYDRPDDERPSTSAFLRSVLMKQDYYSNVNWSTPENPQTNHMSKENAGEMVSPCSAADKSDYKSEKGGSNNQTLKITGLSMCEQNHTADHFPHLTGKDSDDPKVNLMTNKRKDSPTLEELGSPIRKKHRSSEAIVNVLEPAIHSMKLIDNALIQGATQGKQLPFDSEQSSKTRAKRPASFQISRSNRKKVKIAAEHEELCNQRKTLRVPRRISQESPGNSGNRFETPENRIILQPYKRHPKKLSEAMKGAWECTKFFGIDKDAVGKLKKALKEKQASSFRGNNAEVEFWKKAGFFAERLQTGLEKNFKIEYAYQQCNREREQLQNQDKAKWQLLLDNIKKYFECFSANQKVDGYQEISDFQVFEDLKQELLKMDIRCYANEALHDVIHSDILKSEVEPVKTVDDGRCFYHAVALHFLSEQKIGKKGTTLPDLLKILLAFDLLTKEETYVTILDKMKRRGEATKQEMILRILSKNVWADSWIIECMAVFLRRKILSYRKLGVITGESYKKDYAYDVTSEVGPPILVAYVGNTYGCVKPNHYIPLLKKNKTSEPPKLDITEKFDSVINLD